MLRPTPTRQKSLSIDGINSNYCVINNSHSIFFFSSCNIFVNMRFASAPWAIAAYLRRFLSVRHVPNPNLEHQWPWWLHPATARISTYFNIFQPAKATEICLESGWLWKAFEASLRCLRKIEPLIMKQDSTGLRIGNFSLTMFDPSMNWGLGMPRTNPKPKIRFISFHFIVPSLQTCPVMNSAKQAAEQPSLSSCHP